MPSLSLKGCNPHDKGGYPKVGGCMCLLCFAVNFIPSGCRMANFSCLRTTQVLKKGMYITIETGIYFIEPVSLGYTYGAFNV